MVDVRARRVRREFLARPLQLDLLDVETRRFDVDDVRTRCVDSSPLDSTTLDVETRRVLGPNQTDQEGGDTGTNAFVPGLLPA